jgi:hypothetical protein
MQAMPTENDFGRIYIPWMLALDRIGPGRNPCRWRLHPVRTSAVPSTRVGRSEVGMGMAEKRYGAVVLRTMLDQHGRLERGELVDKDGLVIAHFMGRGGLTRRPHQYIETERLSA